LIDKNVSYFHRLLKSEIQQATKTTKIVTNSDNTQEVSYLIAELVAK